jgi:HSP20 family molecular chaperone IbpA
MNTIVHSGQRGLLPELFDLLESPMTAYRPHGQVIRFEDYMENDRYVLRAELPGIDPDKDLEVRVSGGVLTIHGQRQEQQKERYRTEFRFGSFTRSIALPTEANEDDVTAVYHNGILEVTVGLKEAKASERRIAVGKKS